MDESLVWINGKRYCFVSFVVYRGRCRENIIRKELARIKHKFRNRPEVKFTEMSDDPAKEKIMRNIEVGCEYHDVKFLEITSESNIVKTVNILIATILEKFEVEFRNGKKIRILYDKVSYKIDTEEIYQKFPFVEDLDMGDSKKYAGLQHADWVAGNASINFREQKNRN